MLDGASVVRGLFESLAASRVTLAEYVTSGN